MSKFATRYEHPGLPGLVCKSPSHVKQAFAGEVDINEIMARYNRTGVLPVGRDFADAQFGDVSDLTSYQDGLVVIERVQAAFADLPSAVRARFSNDPVQLLVFLQDVGNRDEAVKLGLLAEPVSSPAPVVKEVPSHE